MEFSKDHFRRRGTFRLPVMLAFLALSLHCVRANALGPWTSTTLNADPSWDWSFTYSGGQGDGRLKAFSRGSGHVAVLAGVVTPGGGGLNGLLRQYQNGVWDSSWTTLNALTPCCLLHGGTPTPVSFGGTHMALVSRNRYQALDRGAFYEWNGSSWNSWVNLGGGIVSPPAVTSWGPGNIGVFALGTDLKVYWRYYNNYTWLNSWAGLGGKSWWPASIAAVSPSVGEHLVVVTGTDAKNWYLRGQNFGKQWGSWQQVPGNLGGEFWPAALTNIGNGQAVLSYRNTYHLYGNGVWTGPFTVPGLPASSYTSVTSRGPGKFDIASIDAGSGSNNPVRVASFNGSTWSLSDTGAVGADVAISSSDSNRVDVFVRSNSPSSPVIHLTATD